MACWNLEHQNVQLRYQACCRKSGQADILARHCSGLPIPLQSFCVRTYRQASHDCFAYHLLPSNSLYTHGCAIGGLLSVCREQNSQKQRSWVCSCWPGSPWFLLLKNLAGACDLPSALCNVLPQMLTRTAEQAMVKSDTRCRCHACSCALLVDFCVTRCSCSATLCQCHMAMRQNLLFRNFVMQYKHNMFCC